MAECALDAHRLDAAIGVGEGGDTDDRVQLEQRDRRRWIVEVDLACRELLLQSVRQRVRVDFEADGQRRLGRDAGTDTAVLRTGNGFVQLERVTPKGLAAESVVAESPPALIKHRLPMARDLRIEASL